MPFFLYLSIGVIMNAYDVMSRKNLIMEQQSYALGKN